MAEVIPFPNPSAWARAPHPQAGPRPLTSMQVGANEMTYAEIAEVLGTSENNVQLIEQRALRKLQRVCEAIGLGIEDIIG